MTVYYARRRNLIEEQESFERRFNPISRKTLLFSTVVVCLCSFFFGFHMTSVEVLKPLFSEKNKYATFNMTRKMWDVFSSTIFFGAIMGSIFTTFLHINLKMLLMITVFTFFFGHVLIMEIINYLVIIFGRLIIGIACGFSCSIVPRYLGYLASRYQRGVIGSAHQLFIVLGIFMGQLFSYAFTTPKTIIMMYRSFIAFYVAVFIMLTGVKNVRSVVSGRSKSISDLLRFKIARKSTVMAIIFHVCQQATGINAIMLFSNEILCKNMKNQKLGTISLGLCSIISTIFSMSIVDRFGRKFTIFVSSVLVFAALFMLALNRFVLPSLYLFIVGYALGLGPVVWLITNEIFRDEYKAAANALSITANWISAFFVTFTFPFLYGRISNQIFLIYLCIMIVFFFYVLLAFNETKNRRPDFQC